MIADPEARPQRLVFITGTGTGVGKTAVAVELAVELRRRGTSVSARKPAQSFDPAEEGPLDSERLSVATGEPPETICPPLRSYPIPLAPVMAAQELGLADFMIADLVAELDANWHAPRAAVGLVEGAGGVASPQADDGDAASLAGLLNPDLVVVVANAALGALNLVRLSVVPLWSHQVVVHLYGFDPREQVQLLNLAWLREREALMVTTTIAALADAVMPGEPDSSVSDISCTVTTVHNLKELE